MSFKIGTYSIKIKTYTDKDIGFDDNKKYSNLIFQLYQKVFHIYFVPIFPTEKFWKIKNIVTNKDAETDPLLRTRLNLIELKKKSPFWSYSGSMILSLPIILLIGFVIYSLGRTEVKKINKELDKNKLNKEIVEKIKKPNLSDTYYIKFIEMIPKKDINGKPKGFKKGDREILKYNLISFSNDSIELILMEKPFYFTKSITLKNKVKISKQDLINISDHYKTINAYETIKEKSEIKAEAIFSIDRIKNIKTEN